MAEAPRNRLPSGYDEDFVNAVEDEVLCLICHLLLKEPVQTRCGHRFCKECLEEHFRRKFKSNLTLTCPADRESLDQDKDVFPDKATERKILSLTIKCPNEACDWTGELRNKEIHLESCLFKIVSCTNENCHVTARRKDLEQHVTITCQWRIIKCKHCSELHPHCQDHIAQCSKFPVTCPNNCGVSEIAREMVPNHTENDCPLTIISCPYEQMGCKIKVERKQMKCHLQSAVTLHLDLACVKLNNTEVKLYDTEVKLNDTKVQLNNTEVQLNNTEVKLNDTEVQLNNTEENTMKLMEKLDTLERRFEEKVIKDQENAIQEKKETVKKDISDFPRMFVWKIDGFSEILRQAKTEEKDKIESYPFYIARYGYKLRVNIYPNGSSSGKKTHLSVYIVIMKGEYDGILPWPFKNEVKFTLIDQQEDPVIRKNVTKQLIPDNRPRCYARPVKAKNDAANGYPQFISHEELHSRRYIVDDTLFLQVEVGPPSNLF